MFNSKFQLKVCEVFIRQ